MGSLENQIKAAKNYKAPKGYKPLTTKQKVGLVATAVGPGKVIKAVSKVAKVIKAETKAVDAAQKVTSTAKTPVEIKNPLTRQGRSVKTVSPTSNVSREKLNAMKDAELEMRKSGFYSKSTGKAQERWNKANPRGKKPTVKINSNPYKGK